MTFISLEEAIKRNPDFRPGWQPDEFRTADGNILVGGLSDPKFHGDIQLVVEVNGEGKPLYDRPIIAEKGMPNVGDDAIKTGAVIVPYHIDDESDLYVHIVTEKRDSVYNPLTKDFGVELVGFPRGFADNPTMETILTACKELKEETGLTATDLVSAYTTGSLGVVPNTGNTVNSTDVYFARVGLDQDVVVDKDILSSKFMLYGDFQNQIETGSISCGFTLAADSLFQTFMRHKNLDVYKRALNLG